MTANKDYAIALELQQTFDEEYARSIVDHYKNTTVMKETPAATITKTTNVHNEDEDFQFALRLQRELNGNEASSFFDPSTSREISNTKLELDDPNPDVFSLFVEFDRRYFWGKLATVEVIWSKRMTLCAGVCEYHGQRSGICKIKLSEPLLKYRERKDLLETLLHEMIHAYLFLTNNDRDREGHGPEFQKHMFRLNKETGLNITIYHDFHDEVALYKKHHWLCDGKCRYRPPFFGMVKRAMNRAPSHNDTWWADHQTTCGGTFHKIKEPVDFGSNKRKHLDDKPKNNKLAKIDSFFNPSSNDISSKPPQGNPANKKDSLKFPNVHSFSQVGLKTSGDSFGNKMKNGFTPSSHEYILCDHEDPVIIVEQISRKRKLDPSITEVESPNKVLKTNNDQTSTEHDFSDIFNNNEISKNVHQWPKSFPSTLKISSLEEGERQLRLDNLKIGETIAIPHFISVSNPSHTKS